MCWSWMLLCWNLTVIIKFYVSVRIMTSFPRPDSCNKAYKRQFLSNDQTQWTKLLSSQKMPIWNIGRIKPKLKQTELLSGPYLFTVGDTKQRRTLTKHRLTEQSLSTDRGRYEKSYRGKSLRSLGTGEVEIEIHFLLKCDKYNKIRAEHYKKPYKRYIMLMALNCFFVSNIIIELN